MSAKLSYLIFGISVAVGVVLRSFMLLFTVEAKSGFIKNEYMTPAVLIIVFLLIAAALVFFSAFTQKIGRFRISLKPMTEVMVGILMAIAIFYEAFISSLLDYSTPFQSLIHKCAAILSILAFAYMAFCYFTHKQYPKVITVFPIIFWITRVITVFTEFATLATVSDAIIETASMCLCLFVFLDSAKLQCDVPINNKALSRAIAMLCGYVCLIGSLPRFICSVITPSAFGYFANIPAFTSFAAAFFVLSYAISSQNE